MQRKMPCAASIVFLEALNEKFKDSSHRSKNSRINVANTLKVKDVFTAIPGVRYDKIVLTTTWNDRDKQTSIHAFVERKTGHLIKAATWSSPQKNSDGTLAVRYNLTDENTVKEVVSQADIYGSYLYTKANQ